MFFYVWIFDLLEIVGKRENESIGLLFFIVGKGFKLVLCKRVFLGILKFEIFDMNRVVEKER